MKCQVCDFGGSSVKYAVADENAELTHCGKTPAPLVSEEAFIRTVSGLYGRYREEVDGVALSLPGIIDGATGVHGGSGAYGALLKGKNVAEMIRRSCPVNVAVENDGKCGALAEAWKGALSDVKDGVVLILGTGIGGGVILNGAMHRGLNCTAGEFSYLLTNPGEYAIQNQAWLNAGMVGITYKVCKRKNLDLSVQDAGPALLKYDPCLAGDFPRFSEPAKKVKVDGRRFFALVEEHDPDAEAVYAEFLHALAVLIHNIQVCFAPERIVIGGGLSRVERLLPDIRSELDRLYTSCAVPSCVHARLSRSRYLDECNLLGAMYHYLKQFKAG